MSEVWSVVSLDMTGKLNLEGLKDLIALRLLLKKKREDIDAYLEMLDVADTGYVSIDQVGS